MPFTKTPTYDTQDTKRINAVGSSFPTSTSTSYPVTLNYVNCFPQKQEQFAKDPIYRVVKRQGVKKNVHTTTLTSVSGAISQGSLVVVPNNEYVFFEVGADLCYVRKQPSGLSGQRIATFVGSGGGNSVGTLAIDSGSVMKVVWLTLASKILTVNTDGSGAVINTPSPTLIPDYGLVFLNGYLFGVSLDGKIYNSNAGGVLGTWSSTDFIVPEIYPDFCIHIAKHHNHLIAFSETSTEFFYDGAVEIGSPLVRQETYASKIGFYKFPASAPYTHHPIMIEDDIYFLGKSESRDVGLYRIKDFEIREVSTPFIRKWIDWSSLYPAVTGGNETNIEDISILRRIYVNNEPMIFLDFGGTASGKGYAYVPSQDVWVQMDFSSSNEMNGTPFSDSFFFQFNWDRVFDGSFNVAQAQRPWFLTINGTTLGLGYVDIEGTVNVSATAISPILDDGVNIQRHIRYVDCIGDYDSNTVSLTLYGGRNYSALTTTTAVNFTSDNPFRYYNLGRRRTYAVGVTMTGTGQAYHDAWEITTNRGSW